MRSDLHIHTLYSDGSYSVGEVLDLAKHLKIQCIAITDHDCVGGVEEAILYGNYIGVKVISGIEFSCASNINLHILGYNIDYKSIELNEILDEIIIKRQQRKDKILTKLEAYNIHIDSHKLPSHNVGRAHIAKELKDCGYVNTIGEAFERYLGEDRLAYFPGGRITPIEAVKLIKKLGGEAVIAHPINLLRTNKLIPLILGLKEYGLTGLEVYYPTHSEKDIINLKEIAEKYDLFESGGSDFHGSFKNSLNMMGNCCCELPKKLKNRN